MAKKWNCIDDPGGAGTALAARSLVATVTRMEDLGAGAGQVTIQLRDSLGRPHVPTTVDEAVIDVMLADTAVSPESTLARFGAIVGAGGIIAMGGGTAHVQIVMQASEVVIAVTTTASRPKDCYILVSQGFGSTYLVRAARRWAKLTFGVY